jgi:hypothetical protein
MSTDTGERRVEYIRLDDIQMAPRNPKRHAADAIAASIGHFGLAELPLLDERTGRLIAGHGRITDLRRSHAEGQSPPAGVRADGDAWLVPVVRGWASRSDTDAEAYLLGSNNLTTLGGWDTSELLDMLRGISDTDETLAALTGWTPEEIEDMAKLHDPADLDQLAGDLGEPHPEDNWPIIRLKLPPHLAAAWRSHVDTHHGQETAAFAALLNLDPDDPGQSDWAP